MHGSAIHMLLLAYFPSLRLKYIGLQGHHAICVCVLFPSLQLYKHLTVGVNILPLE